MAVDHEDGQPGNILELNNFLDFSSFHIRYPKDDDLDFYKWYQLTNNSTWLPYDLDLQISSVDALNKHGKDSDLFHNPDKLYYRVANFVIISGISSKSKDDSVTPETHSKQ